MASLARHAARELWTKQTLYVAGLGGWTYGTWYVFYNYQKDITVANYHLARDKSEKYALEKVEQYKQWNEKYQNWKMDKKRDALAWKDRQVKRITG